MFSVLKNTVKLQPERFFESIGRFLFLLIVFGPLLYLIVQTIIYFTTQDVNWYALIFPTGRRLHLLGSSLLYALCVALGGTLIGTLCASALWRWRSPMGIYLRWAVVLLIVIPPYVHALAWMSVIGMFKTLLYPLGLRFAMTGGWLAAWWVNVMALLPIGIGMAMLGFETVDHRLLEAARLQRPETDTLLKIALPLAAPMILAGAGFLFLFTLIEYAVPALFQVHVYAMEIFAAYSASNDPAATLLLALPLLFITMFVLYFSQAKLRSAALKPPGQAGPWAVPVQPPTWLFRGQQCALFVVGLQVLVPLCSLFLMLAGVTQLTQAVQSAGREMVFTFWVCALTVVVTMPLALAAAKALMGNGVAAGVWWFVITIPLALPASLVGIALIALCNRALPVDIYGSAVMPVLAAMTRFAPLAAIVLCAQLKRIDPMRLDAARIYQASPFSGWFHIFLPTIAPGLLAAACITFALTAGELGATLLVVPAGEATLTMRIYNYLHYGASERVAGLCLIITLCAIGLAGLSAYALRRHRRLVPYVPHDEREA